MCFVFSSHEVLYHFNLQHEMLNFYAFYLLLLTMLIFFVYNI